MASIQTVYVALFGRPADPAGLAFFNTATSNGSDLTAIGDLAATAEYQNRFAGKSNTQIITDIYMSLFGHAPDAAGLAFFVDALNTGSQTINSIAINIADGAQGTDKTLLEKKVAAADLFTAALDTPVEIGNYTGTAAAAQGAAFITAVTATSAAPTAASADAAVAALGTGTAPGVTGVNINLVTGAEAVSPSAADPAFKTTTGDDKITGATIVTAANIDGSGGSDSLTLTGFAGGATQTPTIAGVETFTVTTTAAASILDFTKITGEMSVTSSKATQATSFTNITKGTDVGISGTHTATMPVSFGFSDVAGAGDAAKLNLMSAKVDGAAATTTILGIEDLTIANTGSSNLGTAGGAVADGLVATNTSTIKITGSGSLVLDGGSQDFKALTSVNADGSTVATTLDFTNGTAPVPGVSFTGSGAIDNVTFAGNAVKDTIVYTKTNISTISTIDVYAGFVTGTDKVDLSGLGLTGGANLGAFAAAPNPVAEGTSFGGNAAAQQTGTNFVYVDSNNDGVYNQATDLVFNAGAVIATGDVIFS